MDRPTGQSQELERFREYLNFLARVQVDPRLQGKLDLSGVVQQTLWEAYQALPRLRSKDPEKRAAWLRRILANNLADELRKLRSAKRDLGRQRSLEEALDASSAKLEYWLAADQSSPSAQVERQEQALRLAQALAELPEAQRQALILQHWHGWTLAQIGEHLNRTPAAVAGLLKRGLQQLRSFLKEVG